MPSVQILGGMHMGKEMALFCDPKGHDPKVHGTELTFLTCVADCKIREFPESARSKKKHRTEFGTESPSETLLIEHPGGSRLQSRPLIENKLKGLHRIWFNDE